MFSQEILDLSKRHGFPPEEIHRLRNLSEEGIEKLLSDYLQDPPIGIAEYQIPVVKDLVAPRLIAVLDRNDAFTRSPSGRSPGSKALSMLEAGIHEDLKPRLRKWVASGNEHALHSVASHVGSYGSDDLLPELRFLFEQPDKMIASTARGGALAPLGAGRGQEQFVRYVWEHCAWLLNAPGPPHAYDPTRLLIRIDRERTRELLLDSGTLHPDHPLLQEILSALKALDSAPSSEILIHLLENGTKHSKSRKEALERSVFRLLIQRKHPKGDAFVEHVLQDPSSYDEQTVMAAWEGRFRIAGLTPLFDVAFEEHITKGLPLDQLPPDQRAVFLLGELNSEIANGGLSQWFFNDGGAHAAEIRAALKRFGANKHAKVIGSAVRVFGIRGLPRNLEKVRDRLAKMPESSFDKLRALDHRWESLPWWRIVMAEWDWQHRPR